MMQRIGALMVLFALTGCMYCMPDKGDPAPGTSAYFSGCWAEASKNKGK